MRKGTSTSKFGVSGRSNHDSSTFYNSRLYSDNKIIKVDKNDNPFPTEFLNKILNKSSVSMTEIPDSSVHLMITSPPYNVTKEYDDDLSFSEYLKLLKKVFSETYRVLVNGGRICINVANLGRKPYIPLSDYISKMLIEIGFNMRGEIIWNKASSASPSCAWGSWKSASNPVLRDIHEYILVFSKGDFKRNRKRSEMKEKKNSISKEQFMEWTKSIWKMNAVSAKKIGHPAPFPEELPYRLIQLYSFETDIILDPFMGSGTTAVAAIKTKRNYVGYDTSEKYCNLAYRRLRKMRSQLKFDL